MLIVKPNSSVLIVTSQALFGECLHAAVASKLPHVKITAVANTKQACEACTLCDDMLVIFDLGGIPSFTPAETRHFTRQFKNAKVLVVGGQAEERQATAYMEAGAADFRISDSESLDDFCEVIERALHGETSYGPERTQAIFARLQQLSKEVSRITAMETLILTDREMEILQFVDEGKSNKQIASLLHISLHTVKNHVHRILEKLKVSNRREAVRLAYTSGWLRMNCVDHTPHRTRKPV